MTAETKATDFDTVWIALYPDASKAQRSDGRPAINRIEASHSALVAALEAILEYDAKCERSGPRMRRVDLPVRYRDQAEAAIALAKGGGK